MERDWQQHGGHYKAWFSYSWNAVIHATLSTPPTPTPPHPILTQRAKWAHWLEGPSGMVERVSRGSVFPCGSSLWCGRASEKRRIPVKVIRQGSGQETFIALCVRNIVSCQVVFFSFFFFSCVSSVWIGVQFVCLPSFIRKLKMLFVYRWPFFLFPPKQGWEKNTFAVFLSISWHFAFVQIHLYLFFPPFSLSFPYSFFMLWTQKKQAGLCRPRSVEGCPALWWGNKKKKKEKSQLTWGGETGPYSKFIFSFLFSWFCPFTHSFAFCTLLLHRDKSASGTLYVSISFTHLFCVVCMPWHGREHTKSERCKDKRRGRLLEMVQCP